MYRNGERLKNALVRHPGSYSWQYQLPMFLYINRNTNVSLHNHLHACVMHFQHFPKFFRFSQDVCNMELSGKLLLTLWLLAFQTDTREPLLWYLHVIIFSYLFIDFYYFFWGGGVAQLCSSQFRNRSRFAVFPQHFALVFTCVCDSLRPIPSCL